PAIGTAVGGSLSEANVDLLRALAPAHVRIDVDTTRPDPIRQLADALALGPAAPLELALHIDAGSGDQVEELSGHLAGTAIARVLVISAGGKISAPDESTPASLVELVRTRWRGAVPP